MRLPTIAGFLVVGNYMYQYMAGIPNYELALERSYFQAVALFAVFLLGKRA